MLINRTDWEIRTPEQMLPNLINNDMEVMLSEIYQVLKKHNTNYKIIICPNYFRWKISDNDLLILTNIFGEQNLFNYSGDHPIASENCHYNDIEHFNSNVAWRIIEDIYAGDCLE